MLPGRRPRIQDLETVTPKCPQSLGIHETNPHLGSDPVRILSHGIDHSRRKAWGSDDRNRNDRLRELPGERLRLKDGMRQQRNHPIATSFRRPLDLNDVLASATFHKEAGLERVAGPRAMDAPGRPAESVGDKLGNLAFRGSHGCLKVLTTMVFRMAVLIHTSMITACDRLCQAEAFERNLPVLPNSGRAPQDPIY